MLLKDLPSIKVRSEKATGITFSLINILFFLRLAWQLYSISPDRVAILLICVVLLIQILFAAAGLSQKLFKIILRLLHLTGSPLLLFFAFIAFKRLLKPILLDQMNSVQVEVGTWYIAIFLFLGAVIFINFIRDLTHRVLDGFQNPASEDAKSQFLEISHYLVILALIGYWIYTQSINPLPIYSNYDPEYSYMLNALTPFKDLELYARMDHPGTFLQISGSLIAVVLSPISMFHGGYPYPYHINQPEAFLYNARFLILLLNILTVRMIYKYVQYPKTWSGALAGASALIAYFATHTYSFTHLTNWSPNSFNFAVGTYVLLTLYLILSSGKYKDLRILWMVSIAAGLAATFQVYMVTIVLGTISAIFFTSVFERNRWKNTLKYAAMSIAGSIAGYITGTLVILQHYRSFISWIGNVITHQGTYGSGTTGFSTLSDLIQNNMLLWKENPALYIFWFLSVLIFILLSIFQKKNNLKKAPTWAFVIGANLQIILLLILFGKQPGHRYLLSIASIFPLLIICASSLIANKSRSSTFLFSVIFTGLAILFAVNFSSSISNHNKLNEYHLKYQQELKSFADSRLEETGFRSENITYYWTYDTLSPCYSLWFGNDFSKSRFTNEISLLCPNDLQYDIWKNSLEELGDLREMDHLNILILNRRNFKTVDNAEYLNKVESSLRNLWFIEIQ